MVSFPLESGKPKLTGKSAEPALHPRNSLGANGDLVTTLAAFAALACEGGEPARAARLYAATQALREALEIPLPAAP